MSPSFVITGESPIFMAKPMTMRFLVSFLHNVKMTIQGWKPIILENLAVNDSLVKAKHFLNSYFMGRYLILLRLKKDFGGRNAALVLIFRYF